MEIEENQEDGSSVRDLLDKAFDDSVVVDEPVAPEPTPVETEEPSAEVDNPVVEITEELKQIDAPASLKDAIKAKWKDLPRDIQEEWAKRESDIERMMTHPSGELNFGRQMKDVITPYMPLINSVGLKPDQAVQNLLNAEYILRTAEPAKKAELAKNLLKDYGINPADLVESGETEYQDPVISQLLQEINTLKQQTNPKYIQNILQSQKQNDSIMSEIQTFSADPKNVHFEKVRPYMQTLLANGLAETLQDAYDQACRANPAIYEQIKLEALKASDENKRKDLEKKQQAAISVTGSPAKHTSNSQGNQELSLREQLSQAYDSTSNGMV